MQVISDHSRGREVGETHPGPPDGFLWHRRKLAHKDHGHGQGWRGFTELVMQIVSDTWAEVEATEQLTPALMMGFFGAKWNINR